MKTAIVSILLFVASFAVASCPKGSEEYGGRCAEMPSPSESTLAPMVSTNNEKPPRHPEPAWQRGEVKADMGTRAKEPETPVAQDSRAEKAQE